MAGLRFPWELIKQCFGGITAMRESSTIQAFIEEGRRKGLQEGLEEGRAGGGEEDYPAPGTDAVWCSRR